MKGSQTTVPFPFYVLLLALFIVTRSAHAIYSPRPLLPCNTDTGANCNAGSHHTITLLPSLYISARLRARRTATVHAIAQAYDAQAAGHASSDQFALVRGSVLSTLPRLASARSRSFWLVRGCRRPLRVSMLAVQRAADMLFARDRPHARNKLIVAAKAAAICMNILAPVPYADSNYGLFELKLAMVDISAAVTKLSKRLVGETSGGGSEFFSSPSWGQPLTEFAADYGSQNVALTKKGLSITFHGSEGARIKSAIGFSGGVFQAKMKCPSGDTSGLASTFYLSSLEGDPRRDTITMEVLGNAKSRIFCNTALDGQVGGSQAIEVGFDCSQNFHIYTIIWTEQAIIWMVDNLILRTMTPDMAGPFPAPSLTSMFLYASVYSASFQPWGWKAGRTKYIDPPVALQFKAISVGTSEPALQAFPIDQIVDPAKWGDGAGGLSGPLWPVAVDYCESYVETKGDMISIPFGSSGCGGRFHSTQRYSGGTFSGFIKCPAGDASGLIGSFYLSSQEGSPGQDEIDFEFLGKDPWSTQTNYYTSGVGGREVVIPLGFDCSKDFHNYTIQWTKESIIWYVDSRVVRTAINTGTAPFPLKPSYLYASIWDASNVANGLWSGKYTGANAPYRISYSDITITTAKKAQSTRRH